MEIKGIVTEVLELKNGTGSNGEWTSQDFIIKTDGQYPKEVCLNCFKKPTPKVGETVNVFFDPESRKYKENWFTTLRVWKFEGGSASVTANAAPQAQAPNDLTPQGTDLPF
jgi:hypothetical protein